MTALETWCLAMIGLVFEALLAYVVVLFWLFREKALQVWNNSSWSKLSVIAWQIPTIDNQKAGLMLFYHIFCKIVVRFPNPLASWHSRQLGNLTKNIVESNARSVLTMITVDGGKEIGSWRFSFSYGWETFFNTYVGIKAKALYAFFLYSGYISYIWMHIYVLT